MAQPPNKTAPDTAGWEPVEDTSGWEPVDTPSSVASLTANPKSQGTYRLLPPAGSEIKSGQMIPYGNVRTALSQGFGFDPESNDYSRYAHDLFTELHGKGQAPTVGAPDEPLMNQYGVIPTPSPGSKEGLKRGGIKVARGTIDTLPTAGAIVGGVATGIPGAATGPGDLVVAGAGAAAGAGLGEDIRQSLNQKFFGETLTPKQAAERMAGQAALGATQEIGGRAVGIPLGKTANYLGYTADVADKAGIRMLPSEAAGRAPTWMENFLKGSVLSKGMMEKFREAQNKESSAAVDKLMDSISNFKGTPEQLGKVVQKGLEDSEEALRAEQNLLYGALDNITEQVVTPPKPKLTIVLKKNGKPLLDAAGKPVTKMVMQPGTTRVMPSMVGLKDFAREQLEKINKPPYFLPKDVAEKSRDAFNTILNNPDKVSFKRMRDMRSVLLSQVRDLDQAMGGSKLGLAKKFETLTDQSLEDAAKNSGIPGLNDRWRQANEITAEGHRMFEQKLVEKAAETNDPEFIASLLGGNKIGLQQTRDLFKALPAKLHDPVRRGLLEDAVSRATEPRSGAFDEGKFATYVDKIGDERGKIIFGPNWKNVKELVDIIGKINGPVGLAGGGGASLQNVGIMKKLGSIALSGGAETLALATGAGTGHFLEAAQGVATEAAMARTVAWAMTNPAKASKMLEAARTIAKNLPYAASIGYNVAKPMAPAQADKVRGFIEKSAKDLTTPKQVMPVPPPPSGQAYNHVAVHPGTGHVVGSHDGKTWLDVNTGQQVA
jgi:hypothetical protein